MTTLQESTNGHHVLPVPCSVLDSQEENRSEDQTNNNFNPTPFSPTPAAEAFPSSAYHVPPKRFAPRPNAYASDDSFHWPPETEPLPERCQFMFSDGRQCTMARSDIHPSLCTYHSDREQQLFGDPSCRCEARTLDFPALFSACRDLTTAAGVNRALGQVFRLLAQRRISRQEAATFRHLAQLLLRTISDTHSSPESPAEQPEVLISAQPSAQDKNGSSARQPVPTNAHPSAPPITSSASSEPLSEPITAKNSFAINTSATPVCNSHKISTYENVELKLVQNEHLQNNGPAADRHYRSASGVHGAREGVTG